MQGVYNNTTDPTNGGAHFVGSKACGACHPSIAEQQAIHGHANMLSQITDGPPSFPPQDGPAGVPSPPEGFSWSEISYVLGGYSKAARFIDKDGYLLTTGLTGKHTQWLLNMPASGITPQFAPYLPSATAPTPYDFGCFQCHTTGPAPQDPTNPMSQENRPGLVGTWHEAGVHCEACHGPGSNHLPNPAARHNFVDATGAQTCGHCHANPGDAGSGDILAEGGFITHHQQWLELKASGGHAGFACTFCHNPHASTRYDRANGIRNGCTACHDDQNMALHKGKVFRRGDYEEPLTCESCHMPFAVSTASQASAATVGPLARVADTRAHIFRIGTTDGDYSTFFSSDGSRVVRDGQGRAALTVDFVCLRCHDEVSLPNLAFSVERAAEIAAHVHDPTDLND